MSLNSILLILVFLASLGVAFIFTVKNLEMYESYKKFIVLGTIAIPAFVILIQFITVEGYASSFLRFDGYESTKLIRYLLVCAACGGCVVLFLKDQILQNKQLELIVAVGVLFCTLIYVILQMSVQNRIDEIYHFFGESHFDFLSLVKRWCFLIGVGQIAGVEALKAFNK